MALASLALIIVGLLTAEFGRSSASVQLGESPPRVDSGERRGVGSTDRFVFFYYQEQRYPRDCKDLFEQCDGGVAESGVYTIQPEESPEPFKVYCNNSVDGGGWTVFQRRLDGAVEFYRSWAEYKTGFGFLNREFWMGNDKLTYLSNQDDYELRIDFINGEGRYFNAKYSRFRVSDEGSKYRLVNVGDYLPESTATHDSLTRHRNMSFTTYDSDNDAHGTYNCATHYHGAWWYDDCYDFNLNGHYFSCSGCHQSIGWKSTASSWEFNLKYVEMKLRPVQIS